MNRILICWLLAIAIVSMTLAGCCCGGDKKETETVVVAPSAEGPTTGKQLQDLKDAHDKGAITDEEYEKAKEKILKTE